MSTRRIRAQKRFAKLQTRRKDQLKETVKRNYRVVDLRGTGKQVLISMIMEAEYGRNFPELLKPKGTVRKRKVKK